MNSILGWKSPTRSLRTSGPQLELRTVPPSREIRVVGSRACTGTVLILSWAALEGSVHTRPSVGSGSNHVDCRDSMTADISQFPESST